MRLSSTTNDELLPVAKLEWSVRLPNATFATTAEINIKDQKIERPSSFSDNLLYG